jgi:hypothetical protein
MARSERSGKVTKHLGLPVFAPVAMIVAPHELDYCFAPTAAPVAPKLFFYASLACIRPPAARI